MTLADILASLFPAGHDVEDYDMLPHGAGELVDGTRIHIVGIAGGLFPGIDEALVLSRRILDIARTGDGQAIVFMLDSKSQRMSKRDELLGLSETLAHLAKSLRYAEEAGHRTVGLLYGGTAAGAFIASALACGTLVALPGAHPEVMDLPSMARVTKLPFDVLQEKAQSTPVFAPGLDNIFATGGIVETWDPERPLAPQLAAHLGRVEKTDVRAASGKVRGGRPKAADIAAQVHRMAMAHG